MSDVPFGIPVDVPIDGPIAVREHKRNPSSDGPAASGQTPRPARPRRLSSRDQSIIQTIQRFNQVSASQLLRLYFNDHDPVYRQRRCNKAEERLMYSRVRVSVRVGKQVIEGWAKVLGAKAHAHCCVGLVISINQQDTLSFVQ